LASIPFPSCREALKTASGLAGSMPADPVTPGQPVVLYDADESHLLRVPDPGDTLDVDGVGVLSGDLFENHATGDRIRLGRDTYRLLEPTPQRVFETLARGAQVIRPQDAARIAHLTGIGPGTNVVEGGVGSGALTAYLAHLVGPEGQIVAVDNRKDHIATARSNLERAGLAEQVRFVHGDLAEVDRECDAVLIDVPEPETTIPAVERSLTPGGRACFYSPLVEQVAATRRSLQERPFTALRTVEVLERDWIVHEGGSRPDFDMLGHTGFATVATRVTRVD
jgi:tRNA (adenine57-N1/adenine58-N1)-methyltransferase